MEPIAKLKPVLHDCPVYMQIEKQEPAPRERFPALQELEELSAGRKATAVMLLRLLESDPSLIVDRPVDDLENRFNAEGILHRMREEKQRRQFVCITHDANIPVQGDAEMIHGHSAFAEADAGSANIASERMGSVDSRSVRKIVEVILEGGRRAFGIRCRKY